MAAHRSSVRMLIVLHSVCSIIFANQYFSQLCLLDADSSHRMEKQKNWSSLFRFLIFLTHLNHFRSKKMSAAHPHLISFPSLAAEGAGTLYVSCMPGQHLLDPEGAMEDVYRDLQKAAPLVVAMMLPDDEAARLRVEGKLPLRQFYKEAGIDVHQVVVDGFPPAVAPLLLSSARAAAAALQEGSNVVCHCSSGLGRGSVFAVLVVALLRRKEGLATAIHSSHLRDALEWTQQQVHSSVLAKPNPQAFYLSLGETSYSQDAQPTAESS